MLSARKSICKIKRENVRIGFQTTAKYFWIQFSYIPDPAFESTVTTLNSEKGILGD
jgi:hypothetical protein